MVSAEELLTILEQKNLLSPVMVAKLRTQLAQSKKPVSASKVAKLLIAKGYLTPVLVKRLLGAEKEAASEKKSSEEEELGLAATESEVLRGAAAREVEPKSSAAPPPALPPVAARATRAEAESLLDAELAPQEETPAEGAPGAMDAFLSGGAEMTVGSSLAPASTKGWLLDIFRRRSKVAKKDDWGSTLMLVGGGTLLVFILCIIILVWWLNRKTGDELLKEANNDYRNGSYTQAVHKYNKFVEEFPGHQGVSLVRVRRELARLRQVTQPGSDWSAALKVATEVLKTIRQETDFKEARGELQAILPTIAEGLAKRARENPDPSLVAQTRQALDHINKHIPNRLRPVTKIRDVEASLALTVRRIERNTEREKVVAEIKEAVRQNRAADAYAARKKLLKQYSDLLDDPQLTEAASLITQAQRAEVRFVEQPEPPTRAVPAFPVRAAAALLHRQMLEPVPVAEENVAVVVAEGAVFGLETASGKVLWRRPVGFGENAQATGTPPAVLGAGGRDVLLVDQSTPALLRVEGATGKVKWRHETGEAFTAAPVLAAGRILLALPSGKLLLLDPNSGRSPGYFQLPQPLRVAPAVDAVRSLVFQPADHANLYVLQLDDRICPTVYLLGHEEGSLRIPPVVVSGFVVVGINEGTKSSSLRLLGVTREDSGKMAMKTLQFISLRGRLDTPPAVDETRLLAVTDEGFVKVFELTQTEKTTQLREVAETPLPGGKSLMRFALLHNGRFWIADEQLARYDILGTQGRLVAKWIVDTHSAFLQPPRSVGPTVLHVRRSQEYLGQFAATTGKEEPRRFWQTQLAAPLVEALTVESGGKSLLAVTATGGLYRLDAAALRGETLQDEPLVQVTLPQPPRPVARAIALENGRLVLSFGPGAKQLITFDTRAAPVRHYRLLLPAKLSGEPIAFPGGVLAPLETGHVVLLDPQSGEPLREPFQPQLARNEPITWQRPALCGAKEFVIADSQGRLYRVGVKEQPKLHLALLQQVELSGPAATPLAVMENTVILMTANQTLAAYALPELTPVSGAEKQGQPLAAPCIWGPHVLGDRALLATEDARLHCVGAKAEVLWQTSFTHGPPVGKPLREGGRVILAARGGVIAVLDAASGEESAAVDVGRPLATGPVAWGDQWLVGAADGCVYAVDRK